MSENTDLQIPLDINKICTELASKLITSAATGAYQKGKSVIKGLSDDIRLKLESSYKRYLPYVYERYSKAKSFLIRDEATRLYDFYIPQGISCGEKFFVEASISNFVKKNRTAVIRGSAGSGKSMMMRYLFLNTIEKKERVPIFIELRKINDFEQTLIDFIKDYLKENKFNLDDSFIEKAIKDGHFAFFLDGFDEVSIAKRTQLVKEIQSLALESEDNIIIISSRPDDEFSSWHHFDIWDINPLTLSQSLRMIRMIPEKNIDIETRDKFLTDLESKLFKAHSSFLSNPLLLSIMAITYANSGEVPQKISIFYENAYIALFERHDALKGAFKRDRFCKLDILEFKKIFSAFSVLTSINLLNTDSSMSLRFPKTDALKFIDEAKAISDLKTSFNTADFLQDCIKAVCLLIEDGLEITFAHRSFQEYFAAVFIANLDDKEAQKELIINYFTASETKTIELLHEINPSIIEKLILIPTIEQLEKKINFTGKISLSQHKRLLKECFAYVNFLISNHGIYCYVARNTHHDNILFGRVLIFILSNYGRSEFRTLVFKINDDIQIKSLISFKDNQEENSMSVFQFIKNQKLLNFLDTHSLWSGARSNFTFVFTLKMQLVQKHEQINLALKENLLKGLFKKS